MIYTKIPLLPLQFDKVEFIAVVGGEYGKGKILKYFE